MFKIGDILELDSGVLVRVCDSHTLQIIAFVDPGSLRNGTARSQLGRKLPYVSQEKMEEELGRHVAIRKNFSELFIQPATMGLRIIGSMDDKSTDEIILRVIGFLRPNELEKVYNEKCAEKKPEDDEDEHVPYWQYYGLGKEWRGTQITRPEMETIVLTNRAGRVVELKVAKAIKQQE